MAFSIRIIPGLLAAIVRIERNGQWAEFELTREASEELAYQANASKHGLGLAETGADMLARYNVERSSKPV